jgi:hypothetical protein
MCLLVFGTGPSLVALAVASFVWGAASDAFESSQLALAAHAGLLLVTGSRETVGA